MRAALLLACVLAAPAATVTTLDGRTLHGPSIRFDKDVIRIGQHSVPLKDCDWIEPGSGSGVNLGRAALGVWLVDGSWLPILTLSAGKADHVLRVVSPIGTCEIPLAVVRGWSTTADLPGDDTTDRVVLDNGPVAGRVEGIVNGKLLLRSDLSPDKPLEFALDQVRGLRLAVAAKPVNGLALAVTLDPDRPPLRLNPGEPMTLAATESVALPPLADSVLIAARLRIDGGRRLYLSDCPPAEVQEEGAFGVVWPWTRDANLDGSPLRLGGVRHAKGVVVHSKARLMWKLDGAFVRLRALAGIADLVASEGDCAVSLIADGRTLWSSASVKGGEKPTRIDCDLSGVKSLEVRVELGNRYDIGDHFALADAYLVRK
jgi:hypothetical protein